MARCKERLGGRVTHEFLQSQVEIGTGVCATIGEARAELLELRAGGRRDRARVRHADDRRLDPSLGALARAGAGRHGPLPHPRRRASEPGAADGDLRHARACRDRGPGPARRPDEPGQLLHAAPAGAVVVLAVLGGARHRAEGVPADHHRRPAALGPAGDLRELERLAGAARRCWRRPAWSPIPSKIWWDMRPSAKHPTLEIRICDICTWVGGRADDRGALPVDPGVPLHLKDNNQRWRHYRRILILENKWRAQRYGVEAEMADFGKRVLVPFPELIDEMVEILRPHAEALGLRRRGRARAGDGAARDERRPSAEGLPRGAGGRRRGPRGAGGGGGLADRAVGDAGLPAG